MTDIVERMREFLCDQHGEWDDAGETLLREALDEIELLRGSRDEWEACAKNYCQENERLREALEAVEEWLDGDWTNKPPRDQIRAALAQKEGEK